MIGKLKLKGKFEHKQSKKEKQVRRKIELDEEAAQEEEFLGQLNNQENQRRLVIEKPVQNGMGTIFTSRATVHGQNTEFLKQLEIGDSIVLQNPQTFEMEAREIIAILSNKSLLLKEPFNFDLVSFDGYQFRQKPTVQELQTLEEQINNRYEGVTKKIKKDNKQIMEQRLRTGMWGYKTVKKEIDDKISREQMLNDRVKKNRDKFCWC